MFIGTPMLVNVVYAADSNNISSASSTYVGHARQCFTDVDSAYEYLIRQQQRQQQIKQDAIDNAWVNINTASEAELTSLKGIGSHKAQAIILYRQKFGRFGSVDELVNVKGIGKKTLEKNRQRLQVR